MDKLWFDSQCATSRLYCLDICAIDKNRHLLLKSGNQNAKLRGTMARGLGNDIVEIDRIRSSIERHQLHFLNRLFTQKEQDYCYKFKDPAPHFAGRFAAKEAVAKALGTGFGQELSWHDLEILNDDAGRPIVRLTETAQKKFHNPTLLVSISHSATHATAVALWA